MNSDIEKLLQVRDEILAMADKCDLDADLARAMVQLLDHTDSLISDCKTAKLMHLFPVMGEGENYRSKMMISSMKHYRLCAVCEDCDEAIFKDLRVTQLIKLARRDAPWLDFKVKCQNDPSHTVKMNSRYDTRSEKMLPSYYRGKVLAPLKE